MEIALNIVYCCNIKIMFDIALFHFLNFKIIFDVVGTDNRNFVKCCILNEFRISVGYCTLSEPIRY